MPKKGSRKVRDKKIDFQKKFQELEKITDEFESGELDLEKGLKKYEQGIRLANELKKQLTEMENKVKKIRK